MSHAALIQETPAQGNALILMYHRVAEVGSDPWGLCVGPELFTQQLRILKEEAQPMGLRQLTDALERASIPARSVVLTFDDGYADNLYSAKPLLLQHGIPATFFITTGYLGNPGGFWWDELERVVLQAGTLPESLSLRIDGKTRQWALGEAVEYTEAAARRHQGWRTWEEAPTQRHSLYLSLWRLLQPLPEAQRCEALSQIMALSGEVPSAHLLLSPEEVVELAAGDLVEMGAHTVTHPILTTLPEEVQRHEIRQSKRGLEQLLGTQVTSFSYPFGMRTDRTVELVREAGYTIACSTFEQQVERDSDRLQLPRVQVQDWSVEDFRRRLSLWFAG